MSKVLLEFLDKPKELVCPICGSTENFRHGRMQVIKESVDTFEPYYANEYPSEPKVSEDTLDTFECGCGWVMLFDRCGKRIKDDVWDETHNGDTVVNYF